ncbi:hypothetical protein GCM10023145_30450 [Angustibacter luteus]
MLVQQGGGGRGIAGADEQGADAAGVRRGAVPAVVGDGLWQRRAAGWEHGSVVHEPAQEGARPARAGPGGVAPGGG